MHPRTEKERSLDAHVGFFAEGRTRETAMRATREGCVIMPSAPKTDDEWQSEIILTPLGRFMHRAEALELATALGSTLLFIEALTSDHHWVGRAFTEVHNPPLLNGLDEMLIEFETFAVTHAGPRHDHPQRGPHWPEGIPQEAA